MIGSASDPPATWTAAAGISYVPGIRPAGRGVRYRAGEFLEAGLIYRKSRDRAGGTRRVMPGFSSREARPRSESGR
jgi:hypothetical protein